MSRFVTLRSSPRALVLVAVTTTFGVAGCGDDGSTEPGNAPRDSTGGVGAGAASFGGTGGAATGGRGDASTGGLGDTGGLPPTGGAPVGGGGAIGPTTGGMATGGMGTGGTATGGRGTGGAATGGVALGGTATGGMPTGGAPTGGQATGGATTGGAATGGEGTGGMQNCEYSDPPASVAAWVNESWDAQLDDNLTSRQAWLIDNAIMGEGEINLCVRWGATSPPSAEVKSEIEPSVERWLNDWFQALGNYGCFPYPDGVTVKVTGWAVRPGSESWVDDLSPDVAVYTETDGEGEPKCPDACSFFTNWDHQFPNCPGGEAFHTDYWLWVSDALPGGGAAAVGGDWGLRMPVASFVSSLGRDSDLVIEHEMGHGFGFQDYYDWTGSTPEGGSLMIVGSTNQGTPTLGDTWLIRRTWEEMVELRGWTFP